MNTIEKRQATLIAKYGSLEAYREAARKWGKKGGQTGSSGFRVLTPEQRSKIGRLGYEGRVNKLKAQLQQELEHDPS